MIQDNQFHFAPQLFIKSGITDISFYTNAFGAVEIRRFTNDDLSIHVAELMIEAALFQVHEEKPMAGRFDPLNMQGTTVIIGLFVTDVDRVMQQAITAGATVVSPAKTYDYGYRQGQIKDPFGHIWLIETSIA